MRQTAGHLAFDDHRIDLSSDVFSHEIIKNFDFAGFLVDFHRRDVDAVRKRPLIGGEKIFFGNAGRHAALERRTGQGQARELFKAESALRCAAGDDVAIAQN